MNKILYNQTLFIIVSVVVLGLLILSILEYIELGLLIIPIVLPYLIWLFILMRLMGKGAVSTVRVFVGGKKQKKLQGGGIYEEFDEFDSDTWSELDWGSIQYTEFSTSSYSGIDWGYAEFDEFGTDIYSDLNWGYIDYSEFSTTSYTDIE